MTVILEETSTITAKGQTTVPKAVRQALGVGPGDQIVFRVDDLGITVRNATVTDPDPVVAHFLSFLAKDMKERPHALASFSPQFIERIKSLVHDGPVDLDEPIEGPVDLS